MEKCKNSVNETLKIFFSKTTQQNSQILHSSSPWVCVIKVCSNGDTTYITGKIIAKDNLNRNMAEWIESWDLEAKTSYNREIGVRGPVGASKLEFFHPG